MFCSNCGKEIPNDAAFCPNCGSKVVNVILDNVATESATDEVVEETAEVVEESSEVVADNSENAEPEAAVNDVVKDNPTTDNAATSSNTTEEKNIKKEEKANVKKAPDNKKLFIIIGACAAALVTVVIAIFAIRFAVSAFSKKASPDKYNLFYVKENSIYASVGKKYKPVLLSDRYSSSYDSDVSTDSYGRGPQFSKDGKYVFYLDDLNDSYVGDLCYAKYGVAHSDEKLASSVRRFKCLENGKVIYQTSDDKLYITDKKGNREKITSEMINYYVSENEKTVLFSEYDGERTKLYSYDLTKSDADKNKLATVDQWCYTSKDLNTVVYTKDDSLYVLTNLEDETKIDSDVNDVNAYADGNNIKMYYLVNKNVITKSSYDFIDDDYFSNDEKMTEPNEMDYQKVVTKDGFWGARDVVETDDAYYEALDEYAEKRNRDYIRESLKSNEIDLYEFEVFYFDTSKKDPVSLGKLISLDEYTRPYLFCGDDLATGKNINIDKNTNKIKLSDISSGKSSFSRDMLTSYIDLYLYVGSDVYEVNLDDIDANITRDNIYFENRAGIIYATKNSNNSSDLYKVEVNKGELSYDRLESDVDVIDLYALEGSYITLSDCDSKGNGDLKINGEKVSSDVNRVVRIEGGDSNEIGYITDFSDGEGTLNLYNTKSKKSVKVDDEVCVNDSGVYKVNDEAYAYLVDYSERYSTGDLYIYNGKESKKIDTDVSGIFFDYSAKYNVK